MSKLEKISILTSAYNAGTSIGSPEIGELDVAELVEAEAEGSDLATAGCLRGQKSRMEINK